MKHLRKIGLDILARRVMYAIGIPTLILGVAYGLFQLAFVILDHYGLALTAGQGGLVGQAYGLL